MFPQVNVYPPDELLNYSVINEYINLHLIKNKTTAAVMCCFELLLRNLLCARELRHLVPEELGAVLLLQHLHFFQLPLFS